MCRHVKLISIIIVLLVAAFASQLTSPRKTNSDLADQVNDLHQVEAINRGDWDAERIGVVR